MRYFKTIQIKSQGFTLIEMLIAVTMVGIIFPMIFSVMSFALNGLTETEQFQMKNINHKRLSNRLEEDFRTITKFEYLFDDSVGFYTIRNHLFQDKVEFVLDQNSLFYRINSGDKKKIFKDVNTDSSKFEFITYGGDIYEPENGLFFIPPELNTMDKFRLRLFYNESGVLHKKIYTKVFELE